MFLWLKSGDYVCMSVAVLFVAGNKGQMEKQFKGFCCLTAQLEQQQKLILTSFV